MIINSNITPENINLHAVKYYLILAKFGEEDEKSEEGDVPMKFNGFEVF